MCLITSLQFGVFIIPMKTLNIEQKIDFSWPYTEAVIWVHYRTRKIILNIVLMKYKGVPHTHLSLPPPPRLLRAGG